MSSRSFLLVALLALGATHTATASPPSASTATAPAPTTGGGPPPDRISTLVVYGNDPCPRSAGDEIVVCARQPENERYRLPKRFREKSPTVAEGSWTNRVEALDEVSRAGLPDSCSTNGANGQSGCFHKFIAQAAAQRRADKAEAAAIP